MAPPAQLRVFELSPNQISLRIKKAAVAAGLGDGFSGHFAAVSGMAQDLARIGVELPRGLMTAGRWRSPTMPAPLHPQRDRADRGCSGAVLQTTCGAPTSGLR